MFPPVTGRGHEAELPSAFCLLPSAFLVKKLFALSQSPNEAEAMQAFSKAQELLTRHNLSMSDLADSAPEQVEEQIIDESQRPSSWKGAILVAVSKANYCMSFNRHDSQGIKQMMLGRPVNIQSAKIQFEYLVEAVERLAKLENGDRTFKNSFRLGAAHRLHSRIIENMRKQKEEGMAASGNSAAVSAIVMRSLYQKLDAELQAYAKDKLNLKSRSHRPANNSREGYQAGHEAGDRVSLNKQVGGGNQRYLRG